MRTKEYQRPLSQQLNTSNQTKLSTTVLGIALGDDRCLVHMHEVSEVIQTPKITPVPLTKLWFMGMANVRGNLYGITDLSVFLGSPPTPFNAKSRILLVSKNYKISTGFLVNSMLGIRDLSDFQRIDNGKTPDTIATKQYLDHTGRQWRELNLHKLIQNDEFLLISQ